MWRILVVNSGSLLDAANMLQFFGVDPADVFAPYILRRVPDLRLHPRIEKVGRRRRKVQPMRNHVAPMFPGYAFVRCADPVACGKVDWIMQGRGALLRPSLADPPSAISGEWIEALQGLGGCDVKGRWLIGEGVVRDEWRGAPDALAKALASGKAYDVEIVEGMFEGHVAKIEPIVKPEALADAMRRLDESGRIRVCLSLFGSARSVELPREQVELVGESMPDKALDQGAQAKKPGKSPLRPLAEQAAG